MPPKRKLCNCTRYCKTGGCTQPEIVRKSTYYGHSQPHLWCRLCWSHNSLPSAYKGDARKGFLYFMNISAWYAPPADDVRMLLGFPATTVTCCLSSIIFDKFSDKHSLILERLGCRFWGYPLCHQLDGIPLFVHSEVVSLSYTRRC